jgi:hypothetical protein
MVKAVVGLLMATTFVLGSSGASAQVCGDANGNGTIDLTDGVQILRSAASLSSSCSASICDLDGNGTISVTDGVNALRRVAGLSATVGCGTGISSFVAGVKTSDGSDAVLEIGVAPVPGGTAPQTIGTPQGSSTAVAGGSNAVVVPYDSNGLAQALTVGSSDPLNAPLTFVLAVADLNGNLTDGIFEIPLDASAGQVDITVEFPQNLAQQSFLLCPATRNQGVLSQYGALRQDPSSASPATIRFSLRPRL